MRKFFVLFGMVGFIMVSAIFVIAETNHPAPEEVKTGPKAVHSPASGAWRPIGPRHMSKPPASISLLQHPTRLMLSMGTSEHYQGLINSLISDRCPLNSEQEAFLFSLLHDMAMNLDRATWESDGASEVFPQAARQEEVEAWHRLKTTLSSRQLELVLDYPLSLAHLAIEMWPNPEGY